MERTMHRLIIHITDNDKFDKLVELNGLQPYAEALPPSGPDKEKVLRSY